jgi:hypothetical protein
VVRNGAEVDIGSDRRDTHISGHRVLRRRCGLILNFTALFSFAAGFACLIPAGFVALKLPGVEITGSAAAVMAIAATALQTVH